jgi:hypothetical protein
MKLKKGLVGYQPMADVRCATVTPDRAHHIPSRGGTHDMSTSTATPSLRLTVVRRSSALAIASVVLFFLASCSSTPLAPEVIVDPEKPPVVEQPQPDPTPPDQPPVTSPPMVRALTLRGDPEFSAASLTGEAATRYATLIGFVRQGTGDVDPLRLASRDDIYTYGRTLQTYVQAVLAAYRRTGDLTLLDHVDEIGAVMRTQLRDAWRDTNDGTTTRDGYLNWVQRYVKSTTYHGKDVHKLDDMKSHALVAMIAYALHVNRDLTSPGGRDYGASADFWRHYLVDHFEAKWRARLEIDSFPFLHHSEAHVYLSWARFHYYMWKLTGDERYGAEATRMADRVWDDFRTVETRTGQAYVWSRAIISDGGANDLLQPITYARYMFGDMIELHLEGFHRWADPEEMTRIARTFTELVVDNGDPARQGFASDVGGGRPRAGLPSDPAWSRMTPDTYRVSSLPFISPFDATGTVSGISSEIERAGGTTFMLVAAKFVEAWVPQDATP